MIKGSVRYLGFRRVTTKVTTCNLVYLEEGFLCEHGISFVYYIEGATSVAP